MDLEHADVLKSCIGILIFGPLYSTSTVLAGCDFPAWTILEPLLQFIFKKLFLNKENQNLYDFDPVEYDISF